MNRILCITLLSLTSLMGGCGFHFPAATLGKLLDSGISVSSPERYQSYRNQFYKELERAGIKRNGTLQLIIKSIKKQSRVIGSNRKNFDLELLLRHKVTFELKDITGKQYGSRSISASRRIAQDAQQLTTTAALERFYYKEMERESAHRLLLQISQITK